MKKVEKASRVFQDFQDDGDFSMADGGEGGAKVEEEEDGSKSDRQKREEGGSEVSTSRTSVKDHWVADALPAAAETVLPVVGPFRNFGSDFVVDGGGD